MPAAGRKGSNCDVETTTRVRKVRESSNALARSRPTGEARTPRKRAITPCSSKSSGDISYGADPHILDSYVQTVCLPTLNVTSNGRGPMFAAQGLNILGGSFVNYENKTHTTEVHHGPSHRHILMKRSAPDAIHTSADVSREDSCLAGTRTEILPQLRHLRLGDEEGCTIRDVIWLCGPAGSGKSAIMRTLARDAAVDGCLLGSYFFCRSDDKRNSSKTLIPTLACQLSSYIPQAAPFIYDAIVRDNIIFSKSIQDQASELIVEPIVRACTAPNIPPDALLRTPLVCIIDALDECKPDEQAPVIEAMLALTSAIRKKTQLRLKIIIASRPEYRVRRACLGPGDPDTVHPRVTIIPLTDSDAHVALYLEAQFEIIRQSHGMPVDWPPRQEVAKLVRKAMGQYAFARAIIKFLYSGDPFYYFRVLAELSPKSAIGDLNPYEVLDHVYITALREVKPSLRTKAILFLRAITHPEWEPYYVWSLNRLLDISAETMVALSESLSPLVDFEMDGTEVLQAASPYHSTLGDFLLDPVRSKEFFVKPQIFGNAAVCNFLSFLGANLHWIRQHSECGWEVWDHFIVCARSDFFADLVNSCDLPQSKFDELVSRIPFKNYDLGAMSFLQALLGDPVCDTETTKPLVQKFKPSFPWGKAIAQWAEARMSVYRFEKSGLLFGFVLLSLLCEMYEFDSIVLEEATSPDFMARVRLTHFINFIFETDSETLRVVDRSGFRLGNGFITKILKMCQDRIPGFDYVAMPVPTAPIPIIDMEDIQRHYGAFCGANGEIWTILHRFTFSNPEQPSPIAQVMNLLLQSGAIHEIVAAYVYCRDGNHKGRSPGGSLQCPLCLQRLDLLRLDFLAIWIDVYRKLPTAVVKGEIMDALRRSGLVSRHAGHWVFQPWYEIHAMDIDERSFDSNEYFYGERPPDLNWI